MIILIPMAGRGSRFAEVKPTLPKPLIMVGGKPMISRVVESLQLPGQYIFVVKKDKFYTELKSVLDSLVDNYKIIPVENYTDGAAATCLLADQFINNDEELVIANSDQIMKWKVSDFLKNARNPKIDGLVVVYKSRSKKNSYAKIDKNGFVSTISEKVVISSNALTGIHYWRKGSFFVRSAKKMIKAMDLNKGEFYVGPTYNYLVSSSGKIGVFKISNNEYYPVGTPQDLIKYERQNGLI